MFRKLSYLLFFLMLLTGGAFADIPTVTCSAPTTGSTVASPVHFACSATNTTGIGNWKIYVDNAGSAVLGTGSTFTTDYAIADGTHSVTVKAWDSSGANPGSKTLSLTVSTPVVTVNVSSPANNATVTSPVTINASATTNLGSITGFVIYVDSVDTWNSPGATASISAQVTMSAGAHTVLVRAWNTGGTFGSQTLSLTVGSSGGGTGTGVNLNWTSSVNGETANNTSAADTFQGFYYTLGFGHGNNMPRAANTSRVSIHTMLYSGHNTLFFVHDTPWWSSGNDASHAVAGEPNYLASCPVQGSYPVTGTAANGFKSCQSHTDIGVSDELLYQANRKVTDLMGRGVDGVVTDWYGKGSREDNSTLRYKQAADALGFKADGVTPKFYVSPQIDSGAMGSCPGSPSTTNCKTTADLNNVTLTNSKGQSSTLACPTTTVTSGYSVTTDKVTCYVSEMMLAEEYYLFKTYWSDSKIALKWNGRPVVTFFSPDIISGVNGTVHIDWNYIQAFDSQMMNPAYIFRNTGGTSGYNHDTSFGGHYEGTFYWIGHDSTPFDTNYDEVVSAINGYYTTATTKFPSKIAMGGSWAMFENESASWSTCAPFSGSSPCAITAPLCGATFFDSVSAANSYYSSTVQLPYITNNTFTDYEEGSATQPGIDNCWNVNTPTISNKVLSWSLTGIDPDGAGSYTSTPKGGPDSATFAVLKTIHHFTVFVSDRINASGGSERLSVLADNLAVTETTAGCKCFSLDLSKYNLPSATYDVFVKLQSQPFIHNSFTAISVAYTAVGTTNQLPVAQLTVTPSIGFVPLTVTADTSQSTDPDGTIASRSINWGDGTTTSLTGSNVTAAHTYQALGVYTAALTVTDNQGAASTPANQQVTAQANDPIALVTASPTTGLSPLVVTADTSQSTPSAGGAITSRVIDWGDGSPTTTLTGVTATHTYTAVSGSFVINLTVHDSNGGIDTANTTVSIITPSQLGSITISSVVDGGFVFTPLRVQATIVASNGPPTEAQIFVDGVMQYDVTNDGLTSNGDANPAFNPFTPMSIDKYVFMNVGDWHTVMVQGTDQAGQTFNQSVRVFAQGSNQ